MEVESANNKQITLLKKGGVVLGNDLIVLSDRKKKILFGAIDNYIKQANPITSMLVHEQNMKDLSTATLRNELSTLEELGYLKQLHTSSGRVPSALGYRLYVNELIKDDNITLIHGVLLSVDKVFSAPFLYTGDLKITVPVPGIRMAVF